MSPDAYPRGVEYKHTLAKDGDTLEQKYHGRFLEAEFGGYAELWAAYIVPLTGRPDHIDFKTDAELREMGRGHADLCNAQLHYTVLVHLARVWDLRMGNQFPDLESFTEGIVRLSAATDVADELLQRATNPGDFIDKAWDEGRGARQK